MSLPAGNLTRSVQSLLCLISAYPNHFLQLGRYRRLSSTDLERMQVDEASRERMVGEGQTSLDYFSSRQAHEGTDPQSCNCTMASFYRIVLRVTVSSQSIPYSSSFER